MSKTSLLISTISVAALIGIVAVWIMGDDDAAPLQTADRTRAVQDAKPNSIARLWQWENFATEQTAPKIIADSTDEEAGEPEPAEVEDIPFDVVVIYDILQDIELTEDGRIVPDQTAKYALEKGFDDLGPDVSPEALEELQNLIRIGLPGEAGEEAARIMKTYYEYRLAEEEFNRQMENADAESAPSLENYEKLVQMRRQYLGEELADGLYAVEEVQARHMFATMDIYQNAELSDEEKQEQLQALQSRLNERLLALGELTPDEVAAQEVERLRQSGASAADIYAARAALLGTGKAQELANADREEAHWQSHFSGFWEMRQNIMKASLDDEERERQIEQLLNQYFNPDEQERARLTSAQWQSRELQ